MPAFTNDRQTRIKRRRIGHHIAFACRAGEEIGFETRHHCQSPRLPHSAWEDCNLAELAGQLGNMVEHPNQSQANPGLRGDGTLCRLCKFAWVGWSTVRLPL